MAYWHNAEHTREDAVLAAAANAGGEPVDEHPHHDDTNCAIHAQLHMALMVVAWVLFVLCLGLLTLTFLPFASRLYEQRVPARLACRGPPLAV